MKTPFLSILTTAALCGGLHTTELSAQEVKFNDLPRAVQQTINSQIGAGGITSIQRTTRNGIELYEVRSGQSGSKPFYVSATGTVINLDQVIARTPTRDGTRKATFNELPAAVQNTVRAQAGNAPIEDVDVTRKDGQTTYEVAFKREGQNVELAVDPQGKVLRGGQALAQSQARVPLAAATKATFNAVPAAVQNTLRKYAQGAEIEDIDTGTLQGRTVYEAAFKQGGRNIELRVAEDGTLIRDEVNDQFLASSGQAPDGRAVAGTPGQTRSWESAGWQSAAERAPLVSASKVTYRQLPSAVRETLRTYAGETRIEDVDKGMLNGQPVYQAAFKHNGVHTELRIAEDGSLIKDQPNAKFLTQFDRRLSTSAVGRPPSWQALSGGQSSALSNPTQIEFHQLPRAAQIALRSQAGGAPIDKVTRGTVDGQTVYEATFKREGKDVTARVGDDGGVSRR